jgi:hypothetical protein
MHPATSSADALRERFKSEALQAVKKAEVDGESEGRESVAAEIARLNVETDAKLEELRAILDSYKHQADEHCGRVEAEVGEGSVSSPVVKCSSLPGNAARSLSSKQKGIPRCAVSNSLRMRDERRSCWKPICRPHEMT